MNIFVWIIFSIFIIFLLVFDLGILHKKNRVIGVKEAIFWSMFWTLVALLFNIFVYFKFGYLRAMEYLTCYIIERALSVDNIFVFIMIFSYFKISGEYQYKVLFWGILGALIMRFIFIAGGITLVNRFHYLVYILGIFLIYAGVKFCFEKERNIHPEKNVVVRIFGKLFPVTKEFHDSKFIIKKDGKNYATILLITLIVIETMDLVFAIDSVPAALAISREIFIVYSSNIFAILGLRALYFAIAAFMNIFKYLKYGVSLILIFVGLKMIFIDIYKIPVIFSLGMVFLFLMISIVASLVFGNNKKLA